MIFCDICASRCWIIPHTVWTFHHVTFVWILFFWDVTLTIGWVIPGALKHCSSFTYRGQAVFDCWISFSFSVPKIYIWQSRKYDLSELGTTHTVAQCHIPEELNLPDSAIRNLSLSKTSICLVTSRKKRLQILVRWQCQSLSGEGILALSLVVVCGWDLLACGGRLPVLTLRGLTPSHTPFPNSFYLRKSHLRLHKLIWIVGEWVWLMNFRLS